MAAQYQKGSEWRIWDLHVHTPVSALNNQFPKLDNGEPDWDAYVDKLESLGDIAVVGATDYFTIEGYKKLKEYKGQGRLSNIETILPNVEFRLNNVISSRRDGEPARRLNFHVIFSDEVSIQDIEEHFLHDLSFFHEGNPQDRSSSRKLKVSNIEELGRELKEQHAEFREGGRSDLEIGAMQAVVGHEEIIKGLQDKRFKGKYVVVLPEELSSLIDWNGQDHHIRKGLLQESDMVFSSNEQTRSWCLGQDPYLEGKDKFINEFKTLKPCIHGSDAHGLDEIAHPCALRGEAAHRCREEGHECQMRFCWIKADPTFEGLKQLLYEPEERVAIQTEDPTPVKSNYSLETLELTAAHIDDELSIKETKINLNPGLVAVTGGKGSGKTAFVDLIANCYEDRCNSKDKNSFVRRIADDEPELVTKIDFIGEDTFSKNLRDGTFFEDTEITYIAQGELEDYIGDDSDLDIYIRNLIFGSQRDTVLAFEFDELKGNIQSIEGKIKTKNKEVILLEKQTSSEGLLDLKKEKKKAEAELKDIATRIADVQKAQSDQTIKLAKDKQRKIAELKAKKEDLSNVIEQLDEVISFIDRDVAAFNSKISAVNELLTKLEIDHKFISLEYKQEDLTQTLTDVKKTIGNVVREIEGAQKELDKLEGGVRDHAKLLDKNQELEDAIEKIEFRINTYTENEKSLEKAIKERTDLLKQLLTDTVKLKKKYEEIISAFSEEKVDVLSDLNFGVKIHFNKETFIQTGGDVLDNRKVSVGGEEDSITRDLLNKIDKLIEKESDSEIDAVVDAVESINRDNKTKLKKSKAIGPNDFYKFIYGNYFSVIPTVKYKNTPLSKLSLGQKATVLIKIYLAEGEKPIIIDSHDDHLDNEFIMEELVTAIRQAKNYRQIILASNNGNVVINSDAEQIIIANRKEGAISYVAGSIENPKIRDRALEVLEGGRAAFQRRQQKYRLN